MPLLAKWLALAGRVSVTLGDMRSTLMHPQLKHIGIPQVQLVWVCLAATVVTAGCSSLPGFLLRLTPPPIVSQAPAGTDGLSYTEYQSLLDGWREGDTLRQAYLIRADRAPQAAAAADLGHRAPQPLPVEPEPTTARSGIAVPDVSHLPYAQAVEQLAAAGLRAVRQEDVSPTVAAETVLRQQPVAGEEVMPNAVVTLVVSLGNRVRMPAVVGLNERDGLRLVEAAGLRVPSWGINYQGHATDIPDSALEGVCVGCILSTRPPAGSPVPVGGDVYFAVRLD